MKKLRKSLPAALAALVLCGALLLAGCGAPLVNFDNFFADPPENPTFKTLERLNFGENVDISDSSGYTSHGAILLEKTVDSDTFYGLYCSENGTQTPLEYSSIKNSGTGVFIASKKDGDKLKYGVLNALGERLIDFTYDENQIEW
ncbi:MAG: hypothetical protein LBH24_01525, partial [Clostridiales bacterium]|nr:hypothetical protein [Clostridiales bacterium]